METPTPETTQNFKYFDLIMVSFVTLLLCANLIGAPKVCHLWGLTFGGTLIFFPITYLFGDVLTEVYGYKKSRKVVWAGFGALIFACFVSRIMIALPPDPSWNHQEALKTVFDSTPRIVAASLVAYLVGEFSNSFVLAKLKILTKGKWLWTRVVGSTIIGEAVDSIIFYPLAFYRIWPTELLAEVMVTSYLFKVIWETLMMPITYRLVDFLKKHEKQDYFDYKTNFSPFSFEE